MGEILKGTHNSCKRFVLWCMCCQSCHCKAATRFQGHRVVVAVFIINAVKWNKQNSKSTVSREAEVPLFCMAAKWMLMNACISGGVKLLLMSQLLWTVKTTSTLSWLHLWRWRTRHKWTFKYLRLSTVTGLLFCWFGGRKKENNDLKAQVWKHINSVSGFTCLNVDVMQVFLILNHQEKN